MQLEQEQIREQQRESWNKFSPGWKKWDNLFMDFLRPMGEEIIRSLQVSDGDHVLDVASGTGEPGLTIAAHIPSGKVYITDLAESMLKIAEANAREKGLTNIETLACDVCELPFADESFDAISCRLGFMFFPDMLTAAKEMRRVLKRGGKIATSVWNVAESNFWVTAIMSNINKHMQLPPPVPGAPGMFRCAKPGFMSDLFGQAGFNRIQVKEVTGVLNCGTAERYWEVMNDVAAPVVAALSKADEPTREKIRKDVFASVQERFRNGPVKIESSALVITAEK